MTALSADRKTDKLGTEEDVYPVLLQYPVAASTSIYGGALVALDTSGNAVPASANNALKCVGRAEKQALNQSTGGSPGATGSAGSIQVLVRQGAFYFNVNADSTIDGTQLGANVFASDDNTVSLSDAGGTRPYVGFVFDPATSTSMRGNTSLCGVMVGVANPYQANPQLAASSSSAFKARNVVTSLQAYTGSGTNTLTQTTAASGWATQDGVTNAVGDVVFIQGGTANLTDPKDSGPWVVSALGSASLKWVLTRPDWFTTGAKTIPGTLISVGGEGTFWANTTWKSTSGAVTIGTSDPAFYVGRVTFQVTLASGTKVLSAGTGGVAGSNCPAGILSASRSNCEVSLNALGGTNTGTVSFGSKALTPGYVGTAAFSLFAFATAMATQTSDASTLNVTIDNGF